MFAKLIAECLHNGAESQSTEVFISHLPHVAILLTAVFALAQLVLLNQALALYNDLVVIRFNMSFMIVVGSIFFQEFRRFDVESMIVMPVGVISTGFYVALLAWNHNPEEKGELVLGSLHNLLVKRHTFETCPGDTKSYPSLARILCSSATSKFS